VLSKAPETRLTNIAASALLQQYFTFSRAIIPDAQPPYSAFSFGYFPETGLTYAGIYSDLIF